MHRQDIDVDVDDDTARALFPLFSSPQTSTIYLQPKMVAKNVSRRQRVGNILRDDYYRPRLRDRRLELLSEHCTPFMMAIKGTVYDFCPISAEIDFQKRSRTRVTCLPNEDPQCPFVCVYSCPDGLYNRSLFYQ